MVYTVLYCIETTFSVMPRDVYPSTPRPDLPSARGAMHARLRAGVSHLRCQLPQRGSQGITYPNTHIEAFLPLPSGEVAAA